MGMTRSPSALLKLRTNLVWRQVGDEVMVLDTDTSQYLSVNPSGALLWQLLTEGCKQEDLERALLERFDIDEQMAHEGTQRFLSSLKDLNAFEAPPSP